MYLYHLFYLLIPLAYTLVGSCQPSGGLGGRGA